MPRRDRLGRWSRSMFVVPLATFALIFVLGTLRIHGSSIGLVDDSDPSPQAAFDLRAIRSDEWHLRTPMVVRQTVNGFAEQSDVGMGVHDMGALLDFPAQSPAAVVKPHLWPYFVIDVQRAFAIEWWLTVLGPFLGVYAALAAITRARMVSALSGLVATAAPVMAWWTVPWLGISVMYGGFMAAGVILGAQAQGRRRYTWFALGGWAAACLTAELYLPWVIPIGLLFGVLALSQILRAFAGWRQLLIGLGVFGGAFGVLVAIFYLEHRVALQAIADTVYPGRRTTTSGAASPLLMFSAPFDVYSLPVSATVNGTNQSEASSGLMLWLPIAIVGGAFSGLRAATGAARALAASLGTALVFAAWSLLPVPSTFGRLVQLTSVQGSRMIVGLTVASALCAGLYVHRYRTDGAFRPSRDRVIVGWVAFVAVTGWAATRLVINGAAPSRAQLLVLIALFAAATFAVLHGRAVLGLGGAVALLLFSSARVNPVQVGLTAITESPLMHQVEAIHDRDPNARWVAANGDVQAFAVLVGAGVPTVNGFGTYADRDRWRLLDPSGALETVWNRSANIDFGIDNSLPGTMLVAPQSDLILITTPSCNGALQALDVRYVTASSRLDMPCLRTIVGPVAAGERWIYEVTAP